ncbi:MAG TPA: FAD-binding oxidoreductase [Myxococcales bacterium]|nr:FAD-binding oxidoreductase [Myxococcales bacterium]
MEQPRSPIASCLTDASGSACAGALQSSRNPFYLQDQSGGTQSSGYLGAWSAAPSTYAVVAENTEDVAAAVDFARQHRLRLVVKGTGHDYLGRSNAPDSLLVWTHKMRQVTVHDAFVARSCPPTQPTPPAVSVRSGTRWLDVYQEVTVRRGRYVQGGGCTSVGAAGGFMQGGGFGSWSKKYGIAAASLLEAEVVTADGTVRIANACRNQDLFWALRGGGGGTFGIVTRVTLETHPLPDFFGAVDGSIVAKDDASFLELLERFLVFYRESLSNEHWGEQVKVRRNNTLELSLVFQGMSAKQAEEIWRPFRNWVEAKGSSLTMKAGYFEIPGNRMWDYLYLSKIPNAIVADERTTESANPLWWWAGDADQVSTYWAAYTSRWIPLSLFQDANVKQLASALFEASRRWTVGLHFNKGQAGASPEAMRRGRETSMNPAVFDAAALAIVAAGERGFPGVPGHEPDKAKAERASAGVHAAMKIIRDATPSSGSYLNETDYFEPDWQQEFWGENYAALLRIKQKYDPDGLFFCHHCVGSESWSPDGMCLAR